MVHNIVTGLGLAVLLFGLFVFFTAVLGLYRFDYVLNRMHAAAVGDALGIFCILLGLMLLHGWSLPAFKTLETMRRFCRYAQPTNEATEFNLYSETDHLYIWIRMVTRSRDYNVYVHYYDKAAVEGK